MEMLFWVLFAYGTCNILIYGSNFNWWRNLLASFGTGPYSLHKLFTCMMCLPTWVGFFMSFMGQRYLEMKTPALMWGLDNFWIAILVDGIITSACVWLVNTIQEAFERHHLKD